MPKIDPASSAAPVNLLIIYDEVDAPLAEQLCKHLAPLEDQGTIAVMHAGLIDAGVDWHASMQDMVQRAGLTLLLFSSDLCSSAHHREHLEAAMERHERGAARVVPILLRPCDYAATAAGKLRALPRNHVAITSWPNRDEALVDVVSGVREIIAAMHRGAAAGGKGATRPKVTPKYPDAKTQMLSEELERARDRRRNLEAAGVDAGPVEQEIRALRRQLREGGQLRAGDTLGDGRFLLLERVGRGGFSVVWKAEDRERGEAVAVKVLHSELAADPLRRERFFRGAHRMVELAGDAIVPILQAKGEDDGWFFFVMKLISGGDLRQAVLGKRVSAGDIPRLLLQVGSALARAHKRGLVHRDVKPANILLDDDGAASLTDFDLVFAEDTTGGTRTGALGTFVYAAPEMMERPQDADPRADVYGLGMTAIFGLYGRDLPASVLRDAEKIIQGLPANDDVKGVLRRAVEWTKEARFSDAGELCEALRSALIPRARAAPKEEDSEPLLRELTTPSSAPSTGSAEVEARGIQSAVRSADVSGQEGAVLIGGRYHLLRPLPKVEQRVGLLRAGTMVGRYETLTLMSAVRQPSLWAARVGGTRSDEALVALRTLDIREMRDDDLRRIFFEDVATAARIRHLNVIEIQDSGEDRGVLYVAMEWVDGASLYEIWRQLRKSGGVPLGIALRVASQICDGLQAGHTARAGLRGAPSARRTTQFRLRPESVIISTSGLTKIADVGLDVVARRVDPVQSDGYMTPEEVEGAPVDQRRDVFVLGVILFEIVSGLHPFRSITPEDMQKNIARTSPVSLKEIAPETPQALSDVVAKALEKRPADRYASIAAMRRALDALSISLGLTVTMADVGAFVQRVADDLLTSRRRRLRDVIRARDSNPVG